MSVTAAENSTTAEATPTLFPLPLTAFEHYYWLDDTPDYPKTFPFDLKFSGRMDRDRFMAALDVARAQHPLFAALIDDSGKVPQWVAPPVDLTPLVDWANEDVPITHPEGERIDLRREVGLRAFVRVGANETRVLWHVHHACADGGGILVFFDDFLVAYAKASGAGVTAERRDVKLLPQRGHFAATEGEPPSLRTAVRDIAILAWMWSSILFRRTALLASKNGSSESRVDRPAPRAPFEFATRMLDQEQMHALRRVAAAGGATLNDLLLRDMLVVLRDWNQARDPRSRTRLSVNVPVNLREANDALMPAANRIGFAFVTATPTEIQKHAALLEAVRGQTRRIKDWKLALYFLGGLQIAAGVRGMMPWVLRRNRSLATIVLSNVGRLLASSPLPRRDGCLVAGDVMLRRIAAVPPLRPLTRAAMAVYEYGDQTMFCLRCDEHYFGPAEERQLLDQYIQQLQATAHCEG